MVALAETGAGAGFAIASDDVDPRTASVVMSALVFMTILLAGSPRAADDRRYCSCGANTKILKLLSITSRTSAESAGELQDPQSPPATTPGRPLAVRPARARAGPGASRSTGSARVARGPRRTGTARSRRRHTAR